MIVLFQAAGQRSGRLDTAAILQHSRSQEIQDPQTAHVPWEQTNPSHGCCKAGPRFKVFPLAQALGSQWGCETFHLFPTIHKLSIPSLDTSAPCQPSTYAASFLPNPFNHPSLLGRHTITPYLSTGGCWCWPGWTQPAC